MKHSGLHWKGYFAVGEELTSGKPDNKEGLYFGEEYSIESEPVLKKWAMHGPNQFPEPSDVWKTAVLRYMDALTNLGHLIMSAIALSLQLPADFFESKFCNPKHLHRSEYFVIQVDRTTLGSVGIQITEC